MKFSRLYELAINKGIKEDQRSKKDIEKCLSDSKKAYRKAKGPDKVAFDKDSFKNPFADSKILNGTGEEEVRNVMVGIDIDVGEILLADRLREKGKGVDLVISHHPNGRAYAELHKVMHLQSKLWEKLGFSEKVAEGIMKSRIEQVGRGVSSANHTRAQDAAKILDIPLMCIHTAADNCVANFLQKLFNSRKPSKIKDVVRILKSIPEYKLGMKNGAGPYILLGKEKDPVGKVFVDMTGGTSGPDNLFPRLSQSGVNTVIGMHCKESGYKVAASEFLNYVIAGHISSDTLGLNLLFDAIEKVHKINFIECSGFKRIRRK